jgi:hypothetical protein
MTQDVDPPLLTDAETFYAPTLASVANISAAFTNDTITTENIPAFNLTLYMTAPFFNEPISTYMGVDCEQYLLPGLAANIIVPYLDDSLSENFFVGLIATNIVVPMLLNDASSVETIYASSLAANILPPFLTDSDTFYAPTITDYLMPLTVDSDSLFVPIVSSDGHVQFVIYDTSSGVLHRKGRCRSSDMSLQTGGAGTATIAVAPKGGYIVSVDVGTSIPVMGIIPDLVDDSQVDTFYSATV